MQNHVQAANVIAALTANGTNQGFVTVADASPFWPGAKAVLNGTGLAPLEVLILQDCGSGKLRVRDVDAKGAGATDVSAYTTALAASLRQYEQHVFPNPGYGVVSRTPSALK